VRILYGVNGEGMGHATRSRVVIESLLERHEVRVVASGAAFRYLVDLLPHVDEVIGPTFAMRDGEIQRWATLRQNVQNISLEAPDTIRQWMAVAQEWRPEVVISDFEPLAGMFARATRTPLIAVDNINMLDRCRHDREILDGHREDYMLARAVTRSMVPGAVEYMVTTFFYPPPSKRQTTLVPPILRPEIVGSRSQRGDHLVVYSSGEESALAALRASGVRCRVYGMRGGPTEGTVDGNLEFRPRSNEGFVEDLRTSRGVVAGGGFSLMSEAVYLGKPMLALPLHGQFEQVMNSRYLEREGFGMSAVELTPEVLDRFLSGLEGFESALGAYEQEGNTVTLRSIEERALTAAGAAQRDLRRERRGARRRVRRDRSASDEHGRERS